MGVNLDFDVTKLDVCFGGFSPTSMGDSAETSRLVKETEKRLAERREKKLYAEALERARVSEPFSFEDDAGTVWTYVTLDGDKVRIEKCETSLETLVIPSSIEGMPVEALNADSCAYLNSVTEFVCPDSLVSVGPCAFRYCKNLERISFSVQMTDYESDWVRGCAKLKYLKLPGHLDRLEACIFDNPLLEELVVGEGTSEVVVGAFGKSKLKKIALSENNEILSCDGLALYTSGFKVLLALCVPCAGYKVHPSCEAIAKKGFSQFEGLSEVDFPEGLSVLGDFSCSRTGITSFASPNSLIAIGEKAFFNCSSLNEVTLNAGLRAIGQNAFSNTELKSLELPGSIDTLGVPVAANTPLIYSGPDASFSIDPSSSLLFIDEQGGFYRREGEDVMFVQMLEASCTSYELDEECTVIGESAFANSTELTRVIFSPHLREIGRFAFKGCRNLVEARLTPEVEKVAEGAFLDTNLKELYIPASLVEIGREAYVTYGAHHDFDTPSLTSIQADENNEHFFVTEGLLMERKEKGTTKLIVGKSGTEVIHIPLDCDEAAPYALNNITGVRELYLSDRLFDVGPRGLAVDCRLELIHVELVEPDQGHTSFDLRFPNTDRGSQQMMLALSVPAYVDVPGMFNHYDSSIVNASSFDALHESGLNVYEQTIRIIDRLHDPVYMTEVNKSLCNHALEKNISEIAVELALHDDRETATELMDLGYINEENIVDVIECVGKVKDAAMTNFLLEAKRERFQKDAIDFDL